MPIRKKKRDLRFYLPLMLLLVIIGLPARLYAEHLPDWYILYFGDFLWAILLYFLIAVIFGLEIKLTFTTAIVVAYLIEISQLFHPAWLQALRSYKIIGLIIGYGFLWSDIIAYTLGITLGAIIDWTYDRVKGSGHTIQQ